MNPTGGLNESKIEQLKKSLYSRTDQARGVIRRAKLSRGTENVERNWGTPDNLGLKPDVLMSDTTPQGSNFLKNVFLGSLGFFVLALGVAVFIFYGGNNLISANNVDILVEGPVSIAGGEPLSLDIVVVNENDVKLELVDLVVEYPKGTAYPEDTTKELVRFRELIGDIEPQKDGRKNVSAVFFGEENEKKDVKITAEYRVKGSNATFYKEKIYSIFISSTPISIAVDSFSEVNSGQEFTMKFTITSNSSKLLRGIVFQAEYPFGFNFKRAVPSATFDGMFWKIGDLAPGAKRVISLTGSIDGQNDDERVFRLNAGVQSAKDDKKIGIPLLSTQQAVMVKKPFITSSLALDGDASNRDYAGEAGRSIRADVSFVNNLPTNIIDAEIAVRISGTALDKSSVVVERGFYDSANGVIRWDKSNTSELSLLNPGGSGSVSFSFTPNSDSASSNLKNPGISLDVSVRGKRIAENQVPEQIIASTVRTIRVASKIRLLPRILYSIGPFINTGPMPPKSEKETKYTIVWTVTNTSNNVSNAQVRATLPSYVKWLGVTSDADKIAYNPVGGEVLWNIGAVTANAQGISSKEIAFQVAFVPGASQVGTVPTIVNEAVLTGEDDFTGLTLRDLRSSLNTRLSTDPNFENGDERVVQ
jgi:hypothetical protein